jgi:branched-subunit amino acid ABC-type transport system permease component
MLATSEFISYVVNGIPFGCVFGLVAVCIVLAYKTSGIFNFAFAAQAFASAALYYDLRRTHDWDMLPAFLVAVVIAAPLLGLILERFLFRHLRNAPTVAKLVTTLGLFVAIPQIVTLDFLFGSERTYSPPTLWPFGDGDFDVTHPFKLFGSHFGQDYPMYGFQTLTMVVAIIAAVVLTLLFRYTSLGLRMRAVVESPRMTSLVGINSNRVSAFAWALSSLMAGLAGVLIAPVYGEVSINDFTTLLVAAIAAAMLGRLVSIPWALAGGLLLGILQGILGGYLPSNSIVAQGLRPSLPFVMLFALLLLLPGIRQKAEIADPLSGVDPPPPGLAAAARSRSLTYSTWASGAVFIVAVMVVTLTLFNAEWVTIMTKAVIFSVIFLSITVITGLAGQISLAQATFAAIGLFATAQLYDKLGFPVLLGLIGGMVIAAIIGAALAIPVLRLGGIFLALATLAFGLMFDNIFVPLDWVGGTSIPTTAPRPGFVSSDHAFFVFCVVVLVIVGTLVMFIRRGTTGKFLDALRGSETAAAALGISPARARVIAFAISAAIAGLGGGLVTLFEQQANYVAYFPAPFGLFWLLIVVVIGPRTVEGAIQAGLAFALFPELLKVLAKLFGLAPSELTPLQYVLFGLTAVAFSRHPEGMLEFGKRMQLERIQRRLDRRAGTTRAPSPDGTDTEVPAAAPTTPEKVGR